MDLMQIAIVGKIIGILVVVNIVISAASAALEKFKDLTATDTDNKIYAVLSKIAGVLKTILDWATANRKH